MMLLIVMSLSAIAVRAHAVTPADAPPVLYYQAHLMDANGTNLSGNVIVETRIYDSPQEGSIDDLSSGHLLYAESHGTVSVERGNLRIGIGEGSAIGPFQGMPLPMDRIASSGSLYLQLILNGEPIEPRQRIAQEVFAIRAQYAVQADTLANGLTLAAANLPDDISAKKVNGGVLNTARFANVDTSKLAGSVDASHLPQLDFSLLSSDALPDGEITQLDSAAVTTGTFDPARLSNIMTSDDIYIAAGTANDGDVLQVPWLYSQCGYILGLQDVSIPYGHFADSLNVFTTNNWFTKTIHCQTTYQGSPFDTDPNTPLPGGPQEYTQLCTASYMVFCVR